MARPGGGERPRARARRGRALALVLALAAVPVAASADRGGPDRYGYEWVDSREPGLEAEWVEVPDEDREPVEFLGVPVLEGLDLGLATVSFGFSFELYGEAHEGATLVSLGALLFQEIGGMAWQCPLPSPASPNNAIYGFLQLLDVEDETAGDVFVATLGAAPERRFVATFEGVTPWRGVGTPWQREADPVTFQIVLSEGSDEVRVNVLESGTLAGAGLEVTRETVIGIEGPDGTVGTGQCGGGGTIPDRYTVLFRRSGGAAVFPEAQGGAGPAGGEARFGLEVVGFSEEPLVATATARSRLGWPVALEPAELEVPPRGGAGALTATVSIPVDARPGVADDVVVTVRADGQELEALLWPRAERPAVRWQELSPLPMALQGPAVVALEGSLLCLGGSLESERWTPVAATFRLGPDGRWSDRAIADLPHPVAEAGACVLDGRVYLVGGARGQAEVEPGLFVGTAAPGLLVHDPEADRWSAGPPLPLPVLGGALACDPARGRLHLIGGFADRDGDGLFHCSGVGCADGVLALHQVYDLAAGRWESGPPPPRALVWATAGLVEGRVVVAGGSEVLLGDGEGCSILDLASGRWSAGPALPSPRSRSAAVLLDGQLCLLGGFATGGSRSVTSRWDCFDGRSWAEGGDPLPSAVHSAGAGVLAGLVHVAGGVTEDGRGTAVVARWPGDEPADGDGDRDADPDADGPGPGDGDVDGADGGGSLGGGGGGCGCRAASGPARPGAALALAAALALSLGARGRLGTPRRRP